jgi:hypothetical protein
MSPASSPRQPSSPPSPHPPSAKKQKQLPKKQSSVKEPPKKPQHLKKKAKEAPTLPWNLSYEECKKQSQKEVKEHFASKSHRRRNL